MPTNTSIAYLVKYKFNTISLVAPAFKKKI